MHAKLSRLVCLTKSSSNVYMEQLSKHSLFEEFEARKSLLLSYNQINFISTPYMSAVRLGQWSKLKVGR